jgi:hypothetical protein
MLYSDGLPEENGIVAGTIDQVSVAHPEDGPLLLPASRIVRAGAVVLVKGWAVDLRARGPVAGVLLCGADWIVEATYGLPRADVGDHFGDPNLQVSGFEAQVTLGRTLGTTRLRAIAVDASATSVAFLDGEHQLTVVNDVLDLQLGSDAARAGGRRRARRRCRRTRSARG